MRYNKCIELMVSPMVTAQNIVFSLSSAVRIAARKGWKLEVWPLEGLGKKFFWLHIPGKRPTFYSIKKFYADFETYFIEEFFTFRRNHKNLKATRHAYDPLQFGVRNLENNNLYKVVVKHNSRGTAGYYCPCDDHANQRRNVFTLKKTLGRDFEPMCKHCWEASRRVYQMGFPSAEKYLECLLRFGDSKPDYEKAIASLGW